MNYFSTEVYFFYVSVTVDEVATHLEFDIDGSGDVSDEEAKVSDVRFKSTLCSRNVFN